MTFPQDQREGTLIGRGRLFSSHMNARDDETTVVNKYTEMFHAPHQTLAKVLRATKEWTMSEEHSDSFVRILDVRAHDHETMYVAEYADGYTLADWLRRAPRALSKQQKLDIALSLAIAVKDYIAYHNHIAQTCQTRTIPTISTRSIFVFQDAFDKVKCKLSLSFSPFATHGTFVSSANHQDLFELAPEMFHEQRGTTKASLMFGYGMMLYLLETEKVPHANFSSVDDGGASSMDFMRQVGHGLLPALPEDIDPFFGGLIKSTWSPNKLERPKFGTVIDLLRAERIV